MDLGHLNEPQRQAVSHLEGPLLVLAGAGTGKTAVISYRTANLIENGVAPEAILAVTFTNKAAREMKERITRLLPRIEPQRLTISTFHSFCCRVLRKDAHHLGYDHGFGIADDGDQVGVVRQAMGELAMDSCGTSPDDFLAAIGNAKSQIKMPEDVANSRWQANAANIAKVYGRYQELLVTMNLMDFDDLLLQVVRLWQARPEVLAAYRERYRYILVDEFQDTNGAQAEIVRLLAGQTRNVCVVGDDDQSIYGWRGACVSNILEFEESYPGARIIKLEQNYRSTNVILDAANAVIANNASRHGKRLWSAQERGEMIKLAVLDSDTAEAEICGRLVRHFHNELGLAWEDAAILFRSNHQSRTLEDALRRRQVPYRVVGARSFYQRREIRDAAAYLRLVHNPRDDLAFLRIVNVPPRGLGAKSVERLREARREGGIGTLLETMGNAGVLAALPDGAAAACRGFRHAYDQAAKAFRSPGDLARKMNDYLESIGYLGGLKRLYKDHDEAVERRANVLELLNAAAEFEQKQPLPITLQDFLEAFSLMDDSDRTEDETEDDDGVTLMTVHAAKGLEFPAVIIAGLDQGLFPHERALAERDVDEERRLFYVALTRARDRLYLLRARQRLFRGQKRQCRPSEFLGELPTDLVEEHTGDTLLKPASRDEASDAIARLQAMFAEAE